MAAISTVMVDECAAHAKTVIVIVIYHLSEELYCVQFLLSITVVV